MIGRNKHADYRNQRDFLIKGTMDKLQIDWIDMQPKVRLNLRAMYEAEQNKSKNNKRTGKQTSSLVQRGYIKKHGEEYHLTDTGREIAAHNFDSEYDKFWLSKTDPSE